MTCNVSCRPDSTENCQDVTLIAEYNNESLNPAKWFPITNTTAQLMNNMANLSCGVLSRTAPDNYCSQTFSISTGIMSGNNNFSLRCNAISSNAPVTFSGLFAKVFGTNIP